MSKHPHAELMMQYAQDAMETDEPWDRWEVRHETLMHTGEWESFSDHPQWRLGHQYRRKPRTIRIGNFDVPKPMREAPADGSKFWVIWPSADELVTASNWTGGRWDQQILDRGLCHTTREAAELHAKALISLTSNDND